MKGKLLLILLILFSVSSVAQKAGPPELKGNKRMVNGYTIKTLRNADGSYGYIIYKSADRYVKQLRNPYTGDFTGLRKKEDVFKTAEWIVKNIIDVPGALSPVNKEYTMLKLRQPLPAGIAARLGINIK